MTYFLRSGNRFTSTSEANVDIQKKLPTGTYVLKQTPKGELYFEQAENFNITTKLYGDNIKNTKRIVNTFLSRSGATGVMLCGEKGSGKSLLAKTVSIEAQKHNVPTIIINTPLFGDDFNTFIQGIEQPAVILFDEFEKVYDRDEQEHVLTLLDGVFPTKKLFVITVNDKWRVDTHMRNRPGRIFYMLDFTGLEEKFIREYCEDNLLDKSHIDRICKLSSAFTQFNFDMLKGLVEEMNRYNETPDDALRVLNIRPEFNAASIYQISIVVDGVTYNSENGNIPEHWEGNPLMFTKLSYEVLMPTGDAAANNTKRRINRRTTMDAQNEWVMFSWAQQDFRAVSNNTYTFVNPTGAILKLTKLGGPSASSYLDAF